MTTVAELLEVFQQIEDPLNTHILFTEVDKNGDLVKKGGSTIVVTGCDLMKKDVCTHENPNTCGCVDVDILTISYTE